MCSLAYPANRLLVGGMVCLLLMGSCWRVTEVLGQDVAVETVPQASPEIQLNQVSNVSLTRVQQASRLLMDQQWDESIEVIRSVSRAEGDRLISLAASEGEATVKYYLPLRKYVQGWFASLGDRAPEALVRYRRQVDPLAKRWFDQAIATRDIELLQRVVDELFASSYGDDALLRIGEYRLEQGDHAGARAAWVRIFPGFRASVIGKAGAPFHGRPLWMALRPLRRDEDWETALPGLQEFALRRTWLSYPDSDLEPASVVARLILVSILEGHVQRARAELAYLARIYPDSRGRVAARTGPYLETLQGLLDRSIRWESLPARKGWSTFAGTEARSASLVRSIDIKHAPVWFQSLPRWTAEDELMSLVRPRIAEDMHGVLSYFPVVHRDVVYVNEQDRIRAFRLEDGLPAWNPADPTGTIFDAGLGRDQLQSEGKHFGVLRGTLTIEGNRLFARVGSPVSVATSREDPLVSPVGYLVGLDLEAEGKLLPGFPMRPDGPGWAFEGTPLIKGDQLYVGMRRRDQVRSHTYLACFDLDQGKLIWRVLVCSAETPGQGQWPELTHHLLSLEQGILYYNTNAGAIAAVRARDGKVCWVTTYPRKIFQSGDAVYAGVHFFRDLNPCLIHRGLVFVAPADSAGVLALEASTGALLWQSARGSVSDVVHLLGVVGDHLVISGDYLYWLDLYSGQVQQQFPAAVDHDVTSSRPNPRGFGRGVIAGDEVYWPTRETIHVFRVESSASRGSWRLHRDIDLLPRGVSGGHLLLANDRLLLVTANRLFAFRND